MRKIGITSTVASEILWAAGQPPLDLNNIFIGSPDREKLVEYAEARGFPRTTCSWIKGLYAVAKNLELDCVITVTEGDCSNAQALMEVLEQEGVETIPFAYPYSREPRLLKLQLKKLMERFGVGWRAVMEAKRVLDGLRRSALSIDELTWRENKVTGFENHLFLVSCSDMGGDLEAFANRIKNLLYEVEHRTPAPEMIRLGYIGVPPIFPEMYNFVEELGARVVYNEIQRQFAMPAAGNDLVDQYLAYTYPYSVFFRLEDIKQQLQLRQVQGVVHYVQSFCFRHIEDIIIRQHIKLPILTLEGDRPGSLDARTKLRLESFVETLKQWKTTKEKSSL